MLENSLVMCHLNLHKTKDADHKVYSVLSFRTRRVIGYTSDIHLEDAEFRVSDAGRDRARRQGTRNVHAFVVGYPVQQVNLPLDWQEVTYRPFSGDKFFNPHTEEVLDSAPLVWLNEFGVRYLPREGYDLPRLPRLVELLPDSIRDASSGV